MKKPFLFFAFKCAVIIYFAAFTGSGSFTEVKYSSAQITKGNWKVNCYTNAAADGTCIFEGFTFTFEPNGKLIAVKENNQFEGYWLEDGINKKLTIGFKKSGTVLDQLNNDWGIYTAQNGQMSFEKQNGTSTEKLNFTSL